MARRKVNVWSRNVAGGGPYPTFKQSGPTCVFTSVEAAANYVSLGQIAEGDLVRQWYAEAPLPTFDLAVKYLRKLPAAPKTTIYHDDRQRVDARALLTVLSSGAVAVLSVQVHLQGRSHGWHMVSVFNRLKGVVQLWDTNGYSGLVTDAELTALVTGDSVEIPYGHAVLVAHDKHEVLVISP